MRCARHAAAALLVLTSLALGGCQRGASASEYFPLTTGTAWQYRIVRSTMDGMRQQRYAIAVVAPALHTDPSVRIRETLDGQRFYYRLEDGAVYRVGARRRQDDHLVDDQER